MASVNIAGHRWDLVTIDSSDATRVIWADNTRSRAANPRSPPNKYTKITFNSAFFTNHIGANVFRFVFMQMFADVFHFYRYAPRALFILAISGCLFDTEAEELLRVFC